jgi:hypothetical protein
MPVQNLGLRHTRLEVVPIYPLLLTDPDVHSVTQSFDACSRYWLSMFSVT